MGAWGPGSFENDWARNWLGELSERGDAPFVRAELSRVIEHGSTKRSAPSLLERLRGRRHHTDWPTADVASQALVAAEVVAAWRGHPAANLSEGITGWIRQRAVSFDSELPSLARKTVEIVKTNSELKELWEEGDASAWKNGIEDLERRLA